MIFLKSIRSLALILFIGAFVFPGCSQAETKEPSVKKTFASPSRGSASAPFVIEQFSDFFCPYCREQAHVIKKVIEAYPEKARMIFRHFPLSGEPGLGAYPMHEGAVCADEQGKFWEFHDAVFNLEKKVEPSEVAKSVQLDMQKWNACLTEQRARKLITADLADAHKRKVMGTPTFFMNGEKYAGLRPFEFFAEQLDPEFKKKAEDERKKDEEALMKKINFSDEGRPTQGPATAAVTIVEFSDFHCPFCSRMTRVMDQVVKAYPNDVRRIWRNLPLPIHPQSPYAHLAAECANEQGKFWEFHDKLFLPEGPFGKKSDLLKIAKDLSLDIPRWEACYESPVTKKKIENDVLMAIYKKIGSTPTIMINGDIFVGAKSVEKMRELIEKATKDAVLAHKI